MARAGFFGRFLALLIDSIAISIVGSVLTWLLGILAGGPDGIMGLLTGGLAMIVYLILVFLQFVYFGYLWSRNGQSFGMRLLNIKVTRRDGSIPSFWRSGFRGTLGYWISGLIFGLGFIWAAFDGNKEGWHDKIFDTGAFKA